MRIVSVSGACSRAGKTALAETLLRALPGSAAVKFTTTEDVFEACPRGTTCAVCGITVPFKLITADEVLGEPGTDTARLRDAGGRPVIWAIAKESAVAEAWAAVRARLANVDTVVMEGSTITALAHPELHLFVAHRFLSPDRWKATTAALVPAADLVVVNRTASDGRAPSPAVMDALRALHPRALCVADVTQPIDTWAPDLVHRLHTPAEEAVP